jgi:hypothetical protein
MVIKKGDKFLCHTTLYMSGSNTIIVKEGKYYCSEIDGHITDEDGNKKHSFTKDFAPKYFTKISSNELEIEIW